MCLLYMQKWLLAAVPILVLGEAENTVMDAWSFFILHACIIGMYNGSGGEKKEMYRAPENTVILWMMPVWLFG